MSRMPSDQKKAGTLHWLRCIILLSFFFPVQISAAAGPASLPDPQSLTYTPSVFTPPKPDRVPLDNGLVLYVLENHELPLIKITAVIRTGGMYDPPGKEGLAELVGMVMRTGGAIGMTGNAVDATLEQMAASLHSSVDRDSGTLSLSLLSKDRERGIDIFSRILMQPLFEEAKLALAKEMKLGELRRNADQPQKLAFREFGRIMHAGSPRGRLASQASIARIQRDDLLRFHSACYHPERIMITVSGDIAREDAEAIIRRYFGAWTAPPGIVAEPGIPLPQRGGMYVLQKEIPQSVVIFGWLAPSKTDKRFFPFELIDFTIGGGGFGSRIFQEIRTARGLAYSAGSFYTAKSEYGLFGTYAITKSESTLEVVSLLSRIIHDVRHEAILPAEVQRAKNALVNSFIFSFSSADRIAVQRMMIEYEKVPEDFLDTYENRVQAVTMSDIIDAAGRIDPDRAVMLVVGNAEVVKRISESFADVQKVETSL
ncbi:MAG: M16 family metallopeptidase [Syntrophales bacterium]